MATTVGQHSVAAFTSPLNGTSPIDANTVRGNDNTMRSSYVDHDADTGIHVQSSTLASRPAAAEAGRKWITEENDLYTLWFDDGVNWHPVSTDKLFFTVLATEALNKGDVVKIVGWNNGQDIAEVAKTTSASDVAFGIMAYNATINTMGYAINTGLIEDLNTAAFSAGDILYPNASGWFTATKPTSGSYQIAGYVLRSNTNNGVIFVEFSGPHIVESSSNTANTIVRRDASGNFSAGTITATGISTSSLALTSLDVTNIRANDGTASASIANSTGVMTVSAAPVLSALTASQAVFTDGSKGLVSNAITGTGDVVMSASPTLTGTISAAALSMSGTLTLGADVALSRGAANRLDLATGDSLNVVSGTYQIAGTNVLSSTTLGTGVTASSLTSVGTLTSLDVSGNATLGGTLTIGGETYTFPASQMVDGYLKTDGSGNLSWASAGGGGGGGIGGSGSTGKIAKFTSSTDIGNSIITETGAQLDVAGNMDLDATYTYKINNTNVLTATALGSGVTSSSLTSVGTLTALTVSGTATFSTPLANSNLATITTAGKVSNSATTATSTNTASAIVARDVSGNFVAGTITATLSGNASTATTASSVTNALTAGSFLTSGGTYNGSAARTFAVDATSANTASKVVARDASGNFSAGTITATLSGNASTATTANSVASSLTAGTYITSSGTYNGSVARTFAVDATSANTVSKVVARDASGNFSAGTITATLNGAAPAGSLSGTTLAAGVTDSSLTSVGTLGSLTVSGTATVGKVSPTANTVTGNGMYLPAANIVAFSTNGTERARMSATGWFKASNAGTYISTTGAYHEFVGNNNSAALPTLYVQGTGATAPGGIFVEFTASPDNNTAKFLTCTDGTADRCYIYSDGDLANHDGVYGSISDERLKQDIVDAPSQWDDLKAVRFRKYRMKTDVAANPDAPYLLGVVAQELETVSPGLVEEHENKDGTTTKTVKSSILLTKAAVALQEAMARIEALEARLAILEAQ
jgi:hypothetical protein